MRLVAVDASQDDDRTRRAVAVALAQAPRRLFLFRAAATSAAIAAQRDLLRRDDRFLDVAASWLLDGGPGEPPSRARLPVPLLEVGVAVSDRDVPPLPSTTRAIELFGTHLGMAIPDAAQLDGEDIENASIWIAGAAEAPSITENKGRLVIVPGDVIAAGRVAVIDVAAEVRVALVDIDGTVSQTHSTPLTSHATLSVQGQGSR